MSTRYIVGADYGRDLNSLVKGSKFFKYGELIGSETAVRNRIVNRPTEALWRSLELVTVQCLDKIRNKFGPIYISNGYRNQTVNSLVGGSPDSNHTRGIAIDLEPMDNKIHNVDVLIWCYENIKYWELIAEKFGPNPRDGWIHIAYNGTYRKDKLKLLRNARGSRVIVCTIDDIKREYKRK